MLKDLAAACDTVSSRERLLQGIPFSVKESIGIQGYDTTGGMQINITKPCTEDSVVVEVFKRHGAVPFIKTNVPQSLYSSLREIPKEQFLKAYIQKFLRQWKSLSLDAVICPVFPSPAPLLEDIGKLTAAGSGCALYNLINFPAGTVPITRVSKQDIADANNSDLYPAIGKLEKLLKKSCSSEDSEGLPVGVQCVTLPYKEELCLRLMKELETAVSHGPK